MGEIVGELHQLLAERKHDEEVRRMPCQETYGWIVRAMR